MALIIWSVKTCALGLPRPVIVQELCESQGGHPGLSVLTSLLVSVDVKIDWTVLRHWSQLVLPNSVCVCVCVCVCMHVCACMCVHVNKCGHAHYVCVCVYIYVHVCCVYWYAHVYVCVYVRERERKRQRKRERGGVFTISFSSHPIPFQLFPRSPNPQHTRPINTYFGQWISIIMHSVKNCFE